MRYGLALCGGGIRGYVEACFLDILAQKGLISQHIPSSFSVIGGTSIGGLQALAYGVDQTPRYVRTFFEQWGRKIFSNKMGKRANVAQKALSFFAGSPFYERVHLIQALHSVFGTLTLSALHYDDIFVTTFEKKTGCLQIDARQSNLSYVEAALMTSAAPFYFNDYKSTNGIYKDGFVYSNNPSLLVLERLKAQGDDFKLLSLGTGIKATSEKIISPKGTKGEKLEKCFLGQFALTMNMLEGQNMLVQEACKKLLPSGNYVHLDIDLSSFKDPAMDNTNPEFFLFMERQCRDVVEKNSDIINVFFG